ncbi:MAG: Hpt domain-containing protein, partial [Stellaceae bacterium]
MLFDVLRTEVGAHLAIVDAFVGAAQSAPGTPVSAALLHATHTLNGAIAMVELPQISQALMPLEDYVKALQACAQAPEAAGIAALADTSAQIKVAIAALERSSAQLPDFSALAARIDALRAALPDIESLPLRHTWIEDVDDRSLASEDTAPTADAREATAFTAPPMPAEPLPITRPIRVRAEDQAAINAALVEFEAEMRRTVARGAPPEPAAVEAEEIARSADVPDAPYLESVVLQTDPVAEAEPAAVLDTTPTASDDPHPVEPVEPVDVGVAADEAVEFVRLPGHAQADAPIETFHAEQFDGELEAAALQSTTAPAEALPPHTTGAAPTLE